jgi:ATP-dependent helicase HrpA
LESDRPTTQQFPDYLHNGELRLATSYRFDPSHDQDGATVKIPVQALPQVDENLWSWGIPGWRLDLIEALLKALPKDKRRNLVPIPDTAKKLMQSVDAVHLREHIFSFWHLRYVVNKLPKKIFLLNVLINIWCLLLSR